MAGNKRLLALLCGVMLWGNGAAADEAPRGKKRLTPQAKPPVRRAPDERACTLHSDCVQLPTMCPSCAPCSPRLIPVGNRRALKRIQRMQAIVDCAEPSCKPCSKTSNWIGEPRCVKQRCTAVEQKVARRCYQACLRDNMAAAVDFEAIKRMCRSRCRARGKHLLSSDPPPPKLLKSKERACKQDRDCVFRRRSPCACPSCGAVWRTAWNRQAAQKWKLKWSRRRCAKRRCPACATRWIGSKAVCRAGQCTVLR